MAAPNAGIGNLLTLIKRLEAATSRLEDIATTTSDPNTANAVLGAIGSDAAPSTSTSHTGNSTPAPKQVEEPLAPAINAWDVLMETEVKAFYKLSEGLGGVIAQQAICVAKAFQAERNFLVVTTKAKKPDMQSPTYAELVKELQVETGAVDDMKVSANRSSPVFNHLNAVAEGISMLGWIAVDPKPVDFIKQAMDSAQFYGDRVYKEYKDKDHSQIEWLQSYYRIFKALVHYVSEHYPSGVTWNNKDGVNAQEALQQVRSGQSSSKSSSSSGNAPPPPPLPSSNAPPPPPMPSNCTAAPRSSSDMGAVFDQLSKGEAVTSGLRKVDPSLQTHKNPSLRAGAVVPTRSESMQSNSSRGKSPVPDKRPKPESMRTKKPPRKELDGSKWIIENFDNPTDGVIEIEAQISQSILISRCNKATIRVRNKANAISIDSSSQVSLIIDSLISSVDVIKTPRFAMQVFGTLPTILLDQVDGATIYLSKTSLGTEIFTSKCTAVNVNVPGKTDEDDYRECALPEQIKTVMRGGVPVSEIVEHAG